MSLKRRPRGPKLTVKITPEIIERSKRANSKACMIAEAIKESFPEAKAVSVDLQTCRFTDHKRGLRYTYLTPRTGQKPLIDFDQGIHPEPFEMVLRNAHVTRMKGSKKPNHDDGLSKPSMRKRKDGGINRVGGRAPAQMRTTRRFGIKAFQGHEVQAGIVENTESPIGDADKFYLIPGAAART